MQKRSKKAESIMTRPSRSDAVMLEGFRAAGLGMKILEAIRDALPTAPFRDGSYSGPVFKGGALLAAYMNKTFPERFGGVQPADYDFSMNLARVIRFRESGIYGVIESLRRHGLTMQSISDMGDDRRRNPEVLNFEGSKVITLRLLFARKKVDLVMAPRKCNAPSVAAEGDTSVSSIATDASGIVYADPMFVADAANGVYRLRVQRPRDIEYSLAGRFNRLNRRYGDHFTTVALPGAGEITPSP